MQSRYYDPNICRFINADDSLGANQDILSYNLYAYCSNNPIKYVDYTGESAILASILIGTIMGIVIGASMDIITQLVGNGGNSDDLDIGSTFNSAIVGGALGFSTAMGVAYLGPVIAGTSTLSSGGILTAFTASVIVSAIAGGTGYVLQEEIRGNSKNIEVKNVIGHASIVAIEGAYNFGIGGMVGSVGNIGSKGDFFSKEWTLKLLLGQEFALPFKIPMDKLRKGVWGD